MLVGLFLHNIKSYRAGHFIPIMHSSQNNLVCYAGENGTGKSAILEALDELSGMSGEELRTQRYDKYRKMGAFLEGSL